jgi:ureidoglycolate hydrolase
MRTIDIPLETLDADSFRPYGSLVEPHWKAEAFTINNQEVSLRFSAEGTADLYMTRYQRTDGPTSRFERHFTMTEARVSLGESLVFLVAGNPAEDGPNALPDPSTVRAFRIEANQGVILRRGTWHGTSFPLAAEYADLVMFSERESEDELFSGKDPREFQRTQIRDYALEQGVRFKTVLPSRGFGAFMFGWRL